jgi:adenine-specific DNA-methyltransferase
VAGRAPQDRGKNNQMILFSRVEPLAGIRWLHADAESLPNERGADRVSARRPGAARAAERVVVSFGPDHAPLERVAVKIVDDRGIESLKIIPVP